MENWRSAVTEFSSVSIDSSKRIIEGVASAPVYDRVNELITADALKRAVPDYMVLPVVTVGHKEFIAGITKKLWFDEFDKMHIRVQLKPTEDVTPVWNLIEKGYLNAFSIAGTRKSSNCPIGKQSPEDPPCETTDIRLNSITICGSDKCNQEAYFEIAKVLSGLDSTSGLDYMTEEQDLSKSTPADAEVVTPQTPSLSIDYKELAKAIVAEQAEVAKSCEEDKKEDEKEKDMEKSISELKEMIKTQAESFAGLSARLEKLEAIPIGKTLGIEMVNGTPTIVNLDTFVKSAPDGAKSVPMDAREARRLTFRG